MATRTSATSPSFNASSEMGVIVAPPREIARQTGYANEQTLFRAFKRLEGMTPNQYRQLYAGGN